MLDKKEIFERWRDDFKTNIDKLKEQAEKELTSGVNAEVIKKAKFEGYLDLEITFQNNVMEDKRQDRLMALAIGGTGIKVKTKEGEEDFVVVPGSPALLKLVKGK